MNIPGKGYVGVGVVEEPAKKIAEFMVANAEGKQVPILNAPLASPGIGKNSEDPELSEFLIKVRWIKTVPLSAAISEKGFFGNQNTVAHPTTYKWNFTVERLKERLKISD